MGIPWRAIRSFAKTFELSILRRGLARPEDGDAGRAQPIREAEGERQLRSHDDQVGPLPPRERDELVDGAVLHGSALGVRGNARIPRRGHEGAEALALRELPRERVLPAATADQQHLHSSSSTDASVPSRWERAICAHGLPRSSSR